MHSFSPAYIKKASYSPQVLKLLADCMELKGKEKKYLLKDPRLLNELEKISKREESIASNAIEGVASSVDINALSEGLIAPTSDSSLFLRNYYDILIKIKKNPQIELSSETIKIFHSALFKDLNNEERGKFKDKEVFIAEIDSGVKKVRFESVSPELTPKYIKNLCISYEEFIKDRNIPELIIISSFVFDFLCVHPFLDGNGRVSRLLTQLCLSQNGYGALNYISMDKIIKRHSDGYYEALQESSLGWHECVHDLNSWHIFFLSVVREAYVELFNWIENGDARSSKRELVEKVVFSMKNEFSLAEIQRELPTVSNAMIRKVLTNLKKEFQVTSRGKGRGAHWSVIR